MAHDFKWFGKEVRSICVRNLNPETEVLGNLPSPKLEIYAVVSESTEASAPLVLIFSSNPEYHTCNPSWTISVLNPISAAFSTLQCQDLLFRLRDANHGRVLVEYIVDLRRIVQLGNKPLKDINSLPVNSIFLATDNGFYITEKLFVKLKKLGLIPVASRFIGDNDDEADDSESSVIKERMKSSQDNISKLRDQVDSSFGNFERLRHQIEMHSKTAELQELQEELDQLEHELSAEVALEAAELLQLRETQDLQQELECCQDLIAGADSLTKSCRLQKQDLMKIQFLVECRQLKLLSDLLTVYPIVCQDNGEFTIRGIELTTTNLDCSTQRDDEYVSSGLGYVVHLLVLTSKYLEVSLRYQLLFYGSRSMIRDPVAISTAYTGNMGAGSSAGVTLPLYKKGIERDRFAQALDWLRSDVEQLMNTRGVAYTPRHGILQNILQLFACEACPALAN